MFGHRHFHHLIVRRRSVGVWSVFSAWSWCVVSALLFLKIPNLYNRAPYETAFAGGGFPFFSHEFPSSCISFRGRTPFSRFSDAVSAGRRLTRGVGSPFLGGYLVFHIKIFRCGGILGYLSRIRAAGESGKDAVGGIRKRRSVLLPFALSFTTCF